MTTSNQPDFNSPHMTLKAVLAQIIILKSKIPTELKQHLSKQDFLNVAVQDTPLLRQVRSLVIVGLRRRQRAIKMIENKYNGVIKLSPNNSKNALRLYYSRFGDGVIEMLQDVRTIDHRLVFGRMEVGFHAFSLPLIDTSF
jgi:uncharacterized protein (UPF0128 family)